MYIYTRAHTQCFQILFVYLSTLACWCENNVIPYFCQIINDNDSKNRSTLYYTCIGRYIHLLVSTSSLLGYIIKGHKTNKTNNGNIIKMCFIKTHLGSQLVRIDTVFTL